MKPEVKMNCVTENELSLVSLVKMNCVIENESSLVSLVVLPKSKVPDIELFHEYGNRGTETSYHYDSK